jgi:hypothetical protein
MLDESRFLVQKDTGRFSFGSPHNLSNSHNLRVTPHLYNPTVTPAGAHYSRDRLSKFVEAIAFVTNCDRFINSVELAGFVRADTISLWTRDFASANLNPDDFRFLVIPYEKDWRPRIAWNILVFLRRPSGIANLERYPVGV